MSVGGTTIRVKSIPTSDKQTFPEHDYTQEPYHLTGGGGTNRQRACRWGSLRRIQLACSSPQRISTLYARAMQGLMDQLKQSEVRTDYSKVNK